MTDLANRSHGCGVVSRKSKLRDSVLVRARSVGIAGEIESMQLALAAMLGGYQQLLRTIPEGSQARALIDGAFGRSPEVAQKILEAV